MEIKLGRTQYQITSISMESTLLKIILTCQNTQEIVLLLNAEEAQTLVNQVYATVEQWRDSEFRSYVPSLICQNVS